MSGAIREIRWCPEAEAGLTVAAGDDLGVIKSEVLAGVSRLWQCSSEGGGGYIVSRLDGLNEICIVAGEGKGFYEFMPVFLKWCRQQGYTVRTHVKRKGLIKMWGRLGVTFDEYVLRG